MNPDRALIRRLALVGGIVSALLAGAAPAVAHACDCAPWLDVKAPADEAVHPSNGLLIIESSCGGAPEDLEVRVDGREAMLVVEHHRMVGAGYRIIPEPDPGAVVELRGCPGFASCDEADEVWGTASDEELPWGAIDMSFTVGEPDTVAPRPPTMEALDYQVEDYEDFCFGNEAGTARQWSIEIDGQADEPVLYHVSLGPEGSDDPTRTRKVVLESEADLELTLRRFQEDAGRDVCATVRTFDLTGNEADPVRSCVELARNETLDGSCACSVDGGTRGWAGAAMLLLLGGWSRRRR